VVVQVQRDLLDQVGANGSSEVLDHGAVSVVLMIIWDIRKCRNIGSGATSGIKVTNNTVVRRTAGGNGSSGSAGLAKHLANGSSGSAGVKWHRDQRDQVVLMDQEVQVKRNIWQNGSSGSAGLAETSVG
jgi:hypothetical protein